MTPLTRSTKSYSTSQRCKVEWWLWGSGGGGFGGRGVGNCLSSREFPFKTVRGDALVVQWSGLRNLTVQDAGPSQVRELRSHKLHNTVKTKLKRW